MFVLDTNVVSELRRPEKASPKAVAWSLSLPLASFFLSAITVLELELGVLLIERKDKAQGLILRSWIDDQILPRFEGESFQSIPQSPCAALDSMYRTPAPNATPSLPQPRLFMA
jgi:predicted nucleic acid-binding protein